MARSENNPYLSYPKDRTKTLGLWEKFHVEDRCDRACADPYVRLIHEDWNRCRTLGIDPAMRQGVLVPKEEFEEILRNRALLIRKAEPALRKVHDLLADVPGILIFTDEQGTILQISGDRHVRDAAAQSSRIVEGSRWLESLAGTNGIGTAIARRGPVHVYSTEHFCEGWHRWTCAASPILDPFGESVMGVIDFTTIDKDYRDDALALTYSLATSITTELRLQFELERMQLIHNFSMHRTRYPADAVVVVDRMNRVVRSSAGAAEGETLPAALLEDGTGAAREIREIRSAGSSDAIGRLVLLSERRPIGKARSSPAGDPDEVTTFGDFVTRHPAVKTMLRQIEKVIPSHLGILLIGETGTGKELIASHIHESSPRRSGPFVAVNCGAISRELFESRFFGYERGAFTGADPKGRQGLFEAANGGTLFLDEVGEMPLEIQTGLLRVLETGRFRRVGSMRELSTDCRIIAATNRSLLEETKRGTFRSDLFYRLSVASFVIPPLRERQADIPVLVNHLFRRIARSHGLPAKRLTPEASLALASWSWPGNVRELRNVLETAMVCADDPIGAGDLPAWLREATPGGQGAAARGAAEMVPCPDLSAPGFGAEGGFAMKDHVRTLVVSALEQFGNVSHAAKALGISRSRLYRLFLSLEIDHGRYIGCRRPPNAHAPN